MLIVSRSYNCLKQCWFCFFFSLKLCCSS